MNRSRLIASALCAGALCYFHTFAGDAHSRSPSGYSYQHDTVSEVPWSIHILKIDRSNPELQLHTVLAGGSTFGLSSLPEQARLIPNSVGKPIAAINGDFYYNGAPYKGDPKGLHIMRGELISAPNEWTCLWLDHAGELGLGIVESQFSVTWPDGAKTKLGLNERRLPSAAVLYTPAVGRTTQTRGSGLEFVLELDSGKLPIAIGEDYKFRVKEIRTSNSEVTSNSLVLSVGPTLSRTLPKIEPGAVLQISTASNPSLKGALTAISGGPALIRDKKVVFNRSQLRHPRAAVGWNKTHLFFVEVDGRQPNLSLGMTYNEIANYMLKLGCEEALNLDGGGSATLWILGQVMNSPSQGRERSVANALVLVQLPKKADQTTAAKTGSD